MSGAAYQRLLVTGAAGFLGGHLLGRLRHDPDRPRRVVALDLRADGPDSLQGAEWTTCDLTDAQQVRQRLAELAPDGVIHLAGLTGGNDLGAYFRINVLACEHLLSAAAELARPPRVLIVGSAAQYGVTTGTREVIEETRPLSGSTPYGVSKILQERWALARGLACRLPVVCVRPFNIIGPGQSERLVPAAFLRQVSDVAAGRSEQVLVGNLTTARDFTDVRDVVAAMWALMRAGEDADGRAFNIASGSPVKIRDLLDGCIALSGKDIPVRQDPARLKAMDVPTIVGDATRLRELTGWRPAISWRESLADMWEAMDRASGQRSLGDSAYGPPALQ
ncbi:MAG: NAD-dependent epimerase/dehydratase family protein [Phycisphaerae bacterium]